MIDFSNIQGWWNGKAPPPPEVYKTGEVPEPENKNNVHIEMTLTNPNCPVAGQMPENVGKSIEQLEGLKSILVKKIYWLDISKKPIQPDQGCKAARDQRGRHQPCYYYYHLERK